MKAKVKIPSELSFYKRSLTLSLTTNRAFYRMSCCFYRSDISMTRGVRGLINCGFSCCVNALLQSFAATPELCEILSRWQPSDEVDDHSVPMQLKKTFEAMNDRQQPAPHFDFLNCLHHHNIHRYTEHDADEVFHAILTLLQQQMADRDLAAKIKTLYKITVNGCIKCLKCENVHRVPTYFVSLPLHISEGHNTLEDCLQSFFSSQTLEKGEEFYCDTCQSKMPSAQGFELDSLPVIMCIQLKRFRVLHGNTVKLHCKVTFPESMRMDAVIPGVNSEVGNYRLLAVIVHAGGIVRGHYTAYIHSKDKWYYVNDNKVFQVSWEIVQNAYGGDLWSETAYMLLYRKCSSEQVQEPYV